MLAKREDATSVQQEGGVEAVEDGSDLPSGYCTIVLNDEPV